MTTEQQVASHYTHGALQQAIFDALTSMGKDIDRLATTDLVAADEFHLGWRAATTMLAKDLDLKRGMHVLDVGSGIGGPARFFAEAHGCRVTGIDLTEEFVQVATELTRRCRLGDLASFRQGSALDLPFDAGAFDGATLIHVGMNIADKARLFQNVRRVLKPGALFGVYDVMRAADGDLPYPMPWAQTSETSFVENPETYRRLLKDAGFKSRARGEPARVRAQAGGRDAREGGGPDRTEHAWNPYPDGPRLARAPGERDEHAGTRNDRAGADDRAGLVTIS